MQLQTFQAVLGWEAQHINKLTSALKKHPLFSDVEWSRVPDQFHAQLFEVLSEPGAIDDFGHMVDSVEFDLRNRDHKQLRKNQRRYSIRGRWFSRAIDFIKKESEFPESIHGRIEQVLDSCNYEAPLQITLDALGKISGGQIYIDFSNWLETLVSEADEDEAIESASKAMLEAIIMTGSRPELEQLFRAEYRTEKAIRELLEDGISALTKQTTDTMLADPSYALSIISDFAFALVSTKNASKTSQLQNQVLRIYHTLGLGPVEDADKVCEKFLESLTHEPITLAALERLEGVCQIVESISVTTMEERACQKALQEAVTRGAYNEIPALAEKAQLAQNSLAEILSSLKSQEAKLPTDLLEKAGKTENDAIIFISKAMKACANANPQDIADAFSNYTSDQLPLKQQAPEGAKGSYQGPPKHHTGSSEGNVALAPSVQQHKPLTATPINPAVRNAVKSAFGSRKPSVPQSPVACSNTLLSLPIAQKAEPPAVPAELPLTPQPDLAANTASAGLIEVEPELEAEPAVSLPAEVPSVVEEKASEPATPTDEPVRAMVSEQATAQAHSAKVEILPQQGIGDTETAVSTEITPQNGAAALEGCFAACAEERFDVAFWLSWLANRSKREGWNHNAFSAFVFGNRILPDGFIGGELITCLSALHAADFENAPHNRLLLSGGLLAPTLYCADKHAVLYALRDHTETGFPKLDELIANIFDLGINKAIYLTPSDVKRAGESD